jgi:hypothetical protein
MGLSYLTRGMSWSAEYVAKLTPDEDRAELECWATIRNMTGTSYPAAKLTLMAGSPNRATRLAPVAGTPALGRMSVMAGEFGDRAKMPMREMPAPVAVGELYAYKVPSTATIGQDQMNRVSMLGAKTVPIKRDYAIRLPMINPWYYGYDGAQTLPHITAVLSISFVNDEASNLGMPLPAGAVRVYERDGSGDEQYTGAASIGDTPKQEHVNLTLSNVFDVYAQSRLVKSERIDKHTTRRTFEAILHNEKKAPITLRLVQSCETRWKPVTESDPSEKLDASTVQWKIFVKPGEERKLTYAVDMRN